MLVNSLLTPPVPFTPDEDEEVWYIRAAESAAVASRWTPWGRGVRENLGYVVTSRRVVLLDATSVVREIALDEIVEVTLERGAGGRRDGVAIIETPDGPAAIRLVAAGDFPSFLARVTAALPPRAGAPIPTPADAMPAAR